MISLWQGVATSSLLSDGCYLQEYLSCSRITIVGEGGMCLLIMTGLWIFSILVVLMFAGSGDRNIGVYSPELVFRLVFGGWILGWILI